MEGRREFNERLARVLFEKFDVKKRGYLNVKMFRKLSMGVMGVKLTKEQAKYVFAQYDHDQDKKLEFSEFVEFWMCEESKQFESLKIGIQKPELLEIAAQIFELFIHADKNNNGLLEKKEFISAYQKVISTSTLKTLPQPDWAQLDPAGSGSINFEQFSAWFIDHVL